MNKLLGAALLGAVIAFFVFDGDKKFTTLVGGPSAGVAISTSSPTAAASTSKKKSSKKTVVPPLDVGAPRRVIVGLDFSSSNPLVIDPSYARKVGARVRGEFETLAFRSEVRIRTFGAYDSSSNPFAFDAVISTKQRPEVLARDMETFITNIPSLVQQGKMETQPYTNILAFLEEMAIELDCSTLPTQIILVTDGVEDSEYVRLKYRDAKLPRPKKIFSGCYELQMLGVGRGIDSVTETARIRKEWKTWAKRAGFKKFKAVNDW